MKTLVIMVVNRVETACIGGHITLLNVSSFLGYWFWLRNGFRFPSTGKQVAPHRFSLWVVQCYFGGLDPSGVRAVACKEEPDLHLAISTLELPGVLNWNILFERAVVI